MNAPILVINTGNTSTKIAVFDMENPVFVESIKHSDEELKDFDNIISAIKTENFKEKVIIYLNLISENKQLHISDLKNISLEGDSITVLDHCFGCTAGQGSSCGGALT